jgi:hypothetical protein
MNPHARNVTTIANPAITAFYFLASAWLCYAFALQIVNENRLIMSNLLFPKTRISVTYPRPGAPTGGNLLKTRLFRSFLFRAIQRMGLRWPSESCNAEIVKSGTWVYDGLVPWLVPSDVWIVKQNFEYHYEEEYEGEPEKLNEDGECFSVVIAGNGGGSQMRAAIQPVCVTTKSRPRRLYFHPVFEDFHARHPFRP